MNGGCSQNARILAAVDRSYAAFGAWLITPPALDYCEKCDNAAAVISDRLWCEECEQEARERDAEAGLEAWKRIRKGEGY